MPLIQAGDVQLNYREYGEGENVILFVHGNLACLNWMDLVWPKLPSDLHIFAIDWRGCGDSEKPESTRGYANYAIQQHAEDMLKAIQSFGIRKCHLANHSAGGIICTHMLLMEPDWFAKVFCLDPVGPMGLRGEGDMEFFRSMKADREVTYAVMAMVAPSLFVPETLKIGSMPQFSDKATPAQRELYHRLIDKIMQVSDGVRFGTPFHLNREYQSGELRAKQGEIRHPHRVIWGESDIWIPKADMEEMAEKMPDCELRVIPGVGHSLNLEDPDLFAQLFTEYFANQPPKDDT